MGEIMHMKTSCCRLAFQVRSLQFSVTKWLLGDLCDIPIPLWFTLLLKEIQRVAAHSRITNAMSSTSQQPFFGIFFSYLFLLKQNCLSLGGFLLAIVSFGLLLRVEVCYRSLELSYWYTTICESIWINVSAITDCSFWGTYLDRSYFLFSILCSSVLLETKNWRGAPR